MKLATSFVGTALALVLVAGLAEAQERGGGQAVDRASQGGTPTGGVAVPRDSGAVSSPSGGGPGGDVGRSPGGGGDFAVPRGSGDSRGRSFDTRAVSKIEQALEAADNRHSAADARGDFRYSRSRGDQPVVGEAVARGSVAVTPPSGGYASGYPGNYYSTYSYWPWSYGYGRYGYGSFYDPYYGYFPYGYGAFGLGYFYYDPNYWSAPTYPYSSAYQGAHGFRYVGTLRLKVTPRDAEVWVDGYYAGRVDDFDGIFQHIHLDVGAHRIEIRADGYETLALSVQVRSERSTTIARELRKLP